MLQPKYACTWVVLYMIWIYKFISTDVLYIITMFVLIYNISIFSSPFFGTPWYISTSWQISVDLLQRGESCAIHLSRCIHTVCSQSCIHCTNKTYKLHQWNIIHTQTQQGCRSVADNCPMSCDSHVTSFITHPPHPQTAVCSLPEYLPSKGAR